MERKEIIQKFEMLITTREIETEVLKTTAKAKSRTDEYIDKIVEENELQNELLRQALELLKGEGAEAQEEKRYRLKLKPEIADFFRQPTRCSYLNLEKSTGKYSIIGVVEIGDYKTKFTESEIAEMKFPDGVSLDMFEKVEVE